MSPDNRKMKEEGANVRNAQVYLHIVALLMVTTVTVLRNYLTVSINERILDSNGQL
jgi:hypothetical protein